MKAKSLIPILAEIWGVEEDRADKIDRALADGGFRAKGRGRSVPDMTRREAIHFLIGCMTARIPSRAADDVSRWVAADSVLNFVVNEPEDGFVDEDDDSRIRGERLYFQGKMRPFLPEVETDDLPSFISLVDYLLALCGALENSFIDADRVSFEISTSHSYAFVRVEDYRGHTIESQRFEAEKNASVEDMVRSDHQIVTTATVHGDALQALIARTANPFEGGDNGDT